MAELPESHARALEATRSIFAGIAADQWGLPTPCADWDVRTLAIHVVSGNWWAYELGAGKTIEEVGDRLDGDVLGDDPVAAYDASAEVAAEVFRVPGAMSAPCAVSYGPVPGEVYCGPPAARRARPRLGPWRWPPGRTGRSTLSWWRTASRWWSRRWICSRAAACSTPTWSCRPTRAVRRCCWRCSGVGLDSLDLISLDLISLGPFGSGGRTRGSGSRVPSA